MITLSAADVNRVKEQMFWKRVENILKPVAGSFSKPNDKDDDKKMLKII